MHTMIYLEKESNSILLDIITESGDSEGKKQGFIKSCFTAIINLISNAIDNLKNLFTSKSTKKQLEEYEKLLKNNPELMNKKYNIIDVDRLDKLSEDYKRTIKNSENVNKDMEEYRDKRKKKMLKGVGITTAIVGSGLISYAIRSCKKIMEKYNKEYNEIKKETDDITKGFIKKHISDIYARDALNHKDKKKWDKYQIKTNEYTQRVDELYKNELDKHKALVQLTKDEIDNRNFFIRGVFKLFRTKEKLSADKDDFENNKIQKNREDVEYLDKGLYKRKVDDDDYKKTKDDPYSDAYWDGLKPRNRNKYDEKKYSYDKYTKDNKSKKFKKE